MISFCITCRNRLSRIKQTLPANLGRVHPEVEFVLLDYGSTDGLGDWAREYELMMSYHRVEAKEFRMSHAKNVAHRLARGDVLCNLDADNFAPYEFQEYLVRAFTNTLVDLVVTDRADGTHGRIAVRRSVFEKLGGYDESFIGYGWDDNDFRERASRSGYTVLFAPRSLYSELPSGESKAGDYANPDTAETNRQNKEKSEENVRAGRYVANVGKQWGR